MTVKVTPPPVPVTRRLPAETDRSQTNTSFNKMRSHYSHIFFYHPIKDAPRTRPGSTGIYGRIKAPSTIYIRPQRAEAMQRVVRTFAATQIWGRGVRVVYRQVGLVCVTESRVHILSQTHTSVYYRITISDLFMFSIIYISHRLVNVRVPSWNGGKQGKQIRRGSGQKATSGFNGVGSDLSPVLSWRTTQQQ